MKTTSIATLFLVLIVSTSAFEVRNLLTNTVQKIVPQESATECKLCISFVSQSINELIEIIANVGIAGGCRVVCGYLPGSLLPTVCDIACEILGIEEFSKLINEEDPDPIYICSLAKFCPHSTTASANITSFSVSPKSGSAGGTFTIDIKYTVTNEIAVGELDVVVVPPDGPPFGGGNEIIEQKPGPYGGSLHFTATASEQEPFGPGTYKVIGAVCEGSCGSKHKWSQTLSEAQTTFQITQQ